MARTQLAQKLIVPDVISWNFPMSDSVTIHPARSLSGSITLPGDKSISHRYGMIASIAEGPSKIQNFSTGADCHSTLGCMRALGVEIEENGTEVTLRGVGLTGLRAPAADLDAGNSGSTIRMLSGILARSEEHTSELQS